MRHPNIEPTPPVRHERFAARLPANPGDVFAPTIDLSHLAGMDVNVTTPDGRKVRGWIVDAHLRTDGDMHATIEVPEGTLPPLDPGEFGIAPW